MYDAAKRKYVEGKYNEALQYFTHVGDQMTADERARFIEACVEGRFDMRAHETEAMAAGAVRALLMLEGDVSHLLKMPLTSLTKHRAAELRKAATAKRAGCEALEEVTPRQAWTVDLDALRKVLP